jgi:hypothetical protein
LLSKRLRVPLRPVIAGLAANRALQQSLRATIHDIEVGLTSNLELQRGLSRAAREADDDERRARGAVLGKGQRGESAKRRSYMHGDWNCGVGYEAFIHGFRPGKYFQMSRDLVPQHDAAGAAGAAGAAAGRDSHAALSQPPSNADSLRPAWARLRAHVPFSFRKVGGCTSSIQLTHSVKAPGLVTQPLNLSK